MPSFLIGFIGIYSEIGLKVTESDCRHISYENRKSRSIWRCASTV
ncbi:hypothetical protein [Ignatzschineria rhizosphaerae]|nr:hypothetical protein [Ignatzschineria rhizosphaerae]